MQSVTRFNKALALVITKVVSTMWCAYAFAALALLSLPATIATHQLLILVAWIAQTFLQLVLLSVIMVGQKLQAEQTITHVKKHLDDHHAKISKLVKENSNANQRYRHL